MPNLVNKGDCGNESFSILQLLSQMNYTPQIILWWHDTTLFEDYTVDVG